MSARILFVCMGNICRSPTAQGVFERLLAERGLTDQFEVDSAGTHAYHVGEPPDPRAQAAAEARGIDLSRQRARAVEIHDYKAFDHIIAMDSENLALLRRMTPPGATATLGLMLEHARRGTTRDVPDPYYGGPDGFEQVLDLLEDAAAGLLDALRPDRP